MLTIPQKFKNLDDMVRKAVKANRFHFAKSGGKLTGYRPSVGQIVTFEAEASIAKVLRSPNGVGDFIAELESGATVRLNIKSDTIQGYIDEGFTK